MQIGGGTAGGGDYVSSFFSKYLTLFTNKTGSIIYKHVLGSTQEGLRPIGGGYGPMAGVTTRTRGAVTSQRP